MANTSVSLFPMFLMPPGFGPDLPGAFTPDINVLAVEVEEIESVLVTTELSVDYVEPIPVEVTEYIEVEVDVCE